jgi:hypothetical protein
MQMPMQREQLSSVDWVRLDVVGFILLAAIAANIATNVGFPELADRFPFIGAAVWMALQHGGYDWGMLAYAVGFGGSMIWFGSSAGVALSGPFPESRSVGAWIWHG